MAENTTNPEQEVTNNIETGTYEIIQSRLNNQKNDLINRLDLLNDERKKVFGGTDISLVANERIITEQNCRVKDIFLLGNLCILGYNVHLGLRSEVQLDDVFSAYKFIDDKFEPASLHFLQNEVFVTEFKDLYKYYRNTVFSRFFFTENYLYLVFQLSDSVTDIKAYKWLIKDNKLTYVNSRSSAEVVFPRQHEFRWIKATRDMQRNGKHPHISILDKVFVETVGGDLTIKVEDNTDSGLGIYQEEVEYVDQTLDDAEIHFCDYQNLVFLKIKPYQEDDRYFIFNYKEKKVTRVDSLKNSAILLPENQGVIFPNGYALQTGEFKVISKDDQRYHFLRRINAADGENFMYVFYSLTAQQYLLLSYNIIKQTIETPINCNGFTISQSGRLLFLREESEANRSHLTHIWQTPFSKNIQISDELQNHKLFKIGNTDLVRLMADCQELNILLSKQDSYSGLYNDIVKKTSLILDTYYFLNDKEAQKLDEPLTNIRTIAHSAINEYEKVVEIRRNTQKVIDELKAKCERILDNSKLLIFSELVEYINFLAQLRTLRGELIGVKELKYADITLLEELEKRIETRSIELAEACTSFLLKEGALQPYEQQIQIISESIVNLQKAIDAKAIEGELDQLAFQLELLVDIVNNLKIEDTSQSTAIIENISIIFAQLNQQRIELGKKKKSISVVELTAEFQAQTILLEQSVTNFLELANTPTKCDEYLTKLSILLEELETRFIDFDEFVSKIEEKREEVYNHFQSKRVALTEALNKRTNQLYESAKRILKGVESKAESLQSEVEINGYFASDMMVDKVRDIIEQLKKLDDSAKSEEIQTLLKTTQQETVRKLKDKKELYEDGDSIISFGEYKFAVNKQKLDVTMVLRDSAYYYHLTGTSFYEHLSDERLYELKDLWGQDYVSENKDIKRFEYLAWEVFKLHTSVQPEDKIKKAIAEYISNHHGYGFVKGIHDVDALKIVVNMQRLHDELGLLRYSAHERALAHLFWYYLSDERKDFYEKQFEAENIIREAFITNKSFSYLTRELAKEIEEFAVPFNIPHKISFEWSARYLQKENRKKFVVAESAAKLHMLFVSSLKEKGKDLEFIKQLDALRGYPVITMSIVLNALENFIAVKQLNFYPLIVIEAACFIITHGFSETNIVSIPNNKYIEGLKSVESDEPYHLIYHRFINVLKQNEIENTPRFNTLKELKNNLVKEKRSKLRINDFESQVLTTFVRNQLINKVYFPLIGANLSKQIGAVGNNKRTDRMGMLLLVSPPGYGKTTLMEYLANRLGLIFVKINGPSLGNQIISTDPSEAKNAGARQELDKLNLAFEMADNVMLYIDDIQHCNPEFLQKFISLADGQRRIEGIYNGVAKTYDMRSKRLCLVMAGNPYTESGEKFQIPDMLANRADIYNLGDITGSNSDLFDLSLIENAITSNEYLSRLTQPDYNNLYNLFDSIRIGDTPSLQGNFSTQEINDFTAVLKHIIQIRETVLKVNAMYIKSAAQSDEYRNEPPFKLQGSYRNMNKLVSQIQPILNKDEVTQIVLNHYQNESQTLTSGAEANLLKLKELMGLQTADEQKRWDEIKVTFKKNKLFKGLDENNQMQQVMVMLSDFSDGLKGIEKAINKD